MKRAFKPRKVTIRFGEADFSPEQLQGIGSVAVTYNAAEGLIDRMLSSTVGLSDTLRNHLGSRINGVVGKIELIKLGADVIGASAPLKTAITETLGEGGFQLLKRYRDAVIHARSLDSELAIGYVVERRGQQSEVLLSAAALRELTWRLELIRREMFEIEHALHVTRVLKTALDPDDPKRESYERVVQECCSQAQEHRNTRLSLPPLPGFPEEPAIRKLRFL
jgi:hypothetical protein